MNTIDEDATRDIEEIEVTLSELNKTVNKADKLESLKKNLAFKEIIIKGYMEEHAVRLVHLLSDHNITDKLKEQIITDLYSVGSLANYFAAIKAQGDMARNAIKDNQETLEELNSQ